MAESTRLVDLVQRQIGEFVSDRENELREIAPELEQLTVVAKGFLSGGKRFRALFCYWGWHAVSASPVADGNRSAGADATNDLSAVVLAASALEVFHAAALIHDDIMDRSDTRRGAPSAHRLFEAERLGARANGDPATFGTSSALLLGDLLLGWSDELLDRAVGDLSLASAGTRARAEFNRMRTEVTAGQYLDILEESSWAQHPDSEALPRAHRVIVYKSAKYSVEAPLAIGAALAGATQAQLAALRGFGLPLGVAFQLRDDELGVFGDPAVTGKPAGDDLREGKRTVLVALARAAMPAHIRSLVDELIGDATLSAEQVDMLRSAIRDSGALDELEKIIAHNVELARRALRGAPLADDALEQLMQLAETVTIRSA